MIVLKHQNLIQPHDAQRHLDRHNHRRGRDAREYRTAQAEDAGGGVRLIVHKCSHCKPQIRQFGHTRLAVHRVARKTS